MGRYYLADRLTQEILIQEEAVADEVRTLTTLELIRWLTSPEYTIKVDAAVKEANKRLDAHDKSSQKKPLNRSHVFNYSHHATEIDRQSVRANVILRQKEIAECHCGHILESHYSGPDMQTILECAHREDGLYCPCNTYRPVTAPRH